MPPFTACVVQTPSYPYDKAGNLQRALDTMETAAAQGASRSSSPKCSSPATSSGTNWRNCLSH